MSDWFSGRPVPLDQDGPLGVPYDPIAPEWIDRSPIERFDHIVARHGDRLAVDDGTRRLTHAEVRRVAAALAHRLVADAPAGRPVLTVFRHSVLFPAVVLACLASGRPFIPVDLAYPAARQEMIVAQAGAAVVLCQRGVAIDVALPSVPHIAIDLDDLLSAPDARWPVVAFDPDALAGVTYTSGSTGQPKGMAWSVGAFMRSAGEMVDAHHINPDDKIISLGSLASTGLADVMTALLNGASLRIIDIMAAGLAEALRVLDEERITILCFVPSVLRMVLAMDGAAHAFRHLRVLELYGEATLASDVAFFREKLAPGCHIRLVLASIEAGPIFSWFVPPGFVANREGLPCGYLSANKSVRLLREDGEPAAPGEAGEVVVRGRDIALGRWQDGRLVQAPLLPDPDDPRARIFAVGDIVAPRADGLWEFRGRRDRMVKVRGQRVDLGEIETALRGIGALDDVVVVATTQAGDTEIAAYLVARPDAAIDKADLRRHVADQTAEHMVPHRFHLVDAIPRLPNHKPDLVALASRG